MKPPVLWKLYTELLDQDGNGDAFIGAIEVAVVAELRTAFDGITGVVFEDTPFFPKNNSSDEPLFSAAEERSAQRAAEGSAFPRRTVPMDDFDGEHSRRFGVTEFGEEQAASLVDGRKSGFDVKSFESRHMRVRREIVPERLREDKQRGWERAEEKRGMAQPAEHGEILH